MSDPQADPSVDHPVAVPADSWGPRSAEAQRWIQRIEDQIPPPADLDPETTTPAVWVLGDAAAYTSRRALIRDLGRLLVLRGFPLARLTCFIRTLHPQASGNSVIWMRDGGDPTVFRVLRGMESTTAFQSSPMPVIFSGAMGIRRRLDLPGELDDFPILKDLREEGCTDYVAMPLIFSDGMINFVTWAADRPGGFTTAELTELYDLMPALAARLEILERRDLTRQLMEIYLGKETGHRVLAGDIVRGESRSIRAAIWVSDLRDFTGLSDRLPREQIIQLLDAFFELAVQAVEERGGEVLKFLGDGMLAIFPGEDNGDVQACRNALAAARDTTMMIRALNARRLKAGKERIDFGIALHLGEVGYGNIGGAERLDFTVIGPAVNLASRVESLTRALGVRVLASEAFAGCLAQSTAETLTDMGAHRVKGLDESVRVFAPSDLL
jgi:adenylate cyclase